MKFLSQGHGARVKAIETGRELSDLDRFALDFIGILRRCGVEYVVVSGYVSILLGRARASEDIDVIIPRMGFDAMKPVFREIMKGFYCLNADDDAEAFSLLDEGLAARFARSGMVIPNIELKFAKTAADEISLRDSIDVRIGRDRISISPLEMQVAFKEVVLRSPKDMEDARHIRNVAKGYIDLKLVGRYKAMLHGIYGTK